MRHLSCQSISHNAFKQNGFSVIDIMVTLAIVAITLSVGTPAFRDTMLNAQMRSTTNTLVSSLNRAKLEAVKRSERVVVCIADKAQATSGNDFACSSTGDALAVFVSADDSYQTATDELLRLYPDWRQGPVLAKQELLERMDFISFTEQGRLDGTNTEVYMCDERGTDYAKVIYVTEFGMIVTKRAVDIPSSSVDMCSLLT